MKYFKLSITFFSILFFMVACMPKPVVREFPATHSPAQALLEEAEHQYRAKKYEVAIGIFDNLISEYPDSPEALVAIMKNGIIHSELKKFPEARTYFRKLVEKRPSNRLVTDAKIELLNSYFLEGNNQETIRLAPQLFERSTQGLYPLKVYVIVGNAYLLSGEPENAAKLYTSAFRIASPIEKETILEKLKSSIQQIPSDTLKSLIGKMDDRFPKGFLMYQLGLNQMEDGNYSEAQLIFSEFIQKFPSHSETVQAKNLLEKLAQKKKKENYIIGCLLPLSGKYQNLGQMAWTGIELALTEFSSKYQNPVIKVVVRDTGSDVAQTSLAVTEIINDDVSAIIGPMINAEIATQAAQKQEIPIITLTHSSKITDHGDYVFRNFLTPEIQIKSMVSFMVNTFGVKQFAILYPKEQYGTTYMNLFWDEVVFQGGIMVGAQSYDPSMTDFRDPIQKLSRLFNKVPDTLLTQYLDFFLMNRVSDENIPSPSSTQTSGIEFGAIFIPDSPSKAGMILPQLAYHDVAGVYFLGTNLWHSDKFIHLAGDYAYKAILTDGFFAGSSNPLVRSFVENFEYAYGKTPGFVEAVAYDTAMLLMEIFAEKSIESNSQLKDSLIKVHEYPGVTGKTSFDPTGEAHKEAYVLCTKNKKFMELQRP